MKQSSGIKSGALTAVDAAAMMLLNQSAHANNLVATIYGFYDATNSSNGLENGTTVTHYSNNGQSGSDNPSLFIVNPTGQAMSHVTLNLTGYQDVAGNGGSAATFNGANSSPSVEKLSIANVPAHTVFQVGWGGGASVVTGPTGIDLFAGDYDDSLGQPSTLQQYPSLTVPSEIRCLIRKLRAYKRVLALRRRAADRSGRGGRGIGVADVRRQRYADGLEELSRHAGHRRAQDEALPVLLGLDFL